MAEHTGTTNHPSHFGTNTRPLARFGTNTRPPRASARTLENNNCIGAARGRRARHHDTGYRGPTGATNVPAICGLWHSHVGGMPRTLVRFGTGWRREGRGVPRGALEPMVSGVEIHSSPDGRKGQTPYLQSRPPLRAGRGRPVAQAKRATLPDPPVHNVAAVV